MDFVRANHSGLFHSGQMAGISVYGQCGRRGNRYGRTDSAHTGAFLSGSVGKAGGGRGAEGRKSYGAVHDSYFYGSDSACGAGNGFFRHDGRCGYLVRMARRMGHRNDSFPDIL